MKELPKRAFDLVVLDIGLVDGRGTRMIRELRQLQEKVRVLICSARDKISNALDYITAGANGHLNKNTTHAQIEQAISTVANEQVHLVLYN